MKFEDFLVLVKESVLENFMEINKWFLKSEELRNYRPKNGGWTIDEILEHISLTNHFLLIIINKGKEKALKKNEEINPREFYYEKSELENFLKIGEHRSFQWIRPEHMEPRGKESLENVKVKIKEQVCNCLDVLDVLKDGKGLLVKTQMSVNDLGKIDVYQYIYFLSLHGRRHIEQMEKNELEFKSERKADKWLVVYDSIERNYEEFDNEKEALERYEKLNDSVTVEEVFLTKVIK